MISVIIDTGAALGLGGPFTYMLWRIGQFRSAMRRGKVPHIFDPHVRRDMHGPHVMKWCDVCQQGPKALIHTNRRSGDIFDDAYFDPPRILSLEIDDIKWRFANDPEWVEVFGDEYDPKTFQLIPQLHNGECGGPHDSCERCAWEADEADAKAKEQRELERTKFYKEDSQRAAAEKKLNAQELEGYESILWSIWNTLPGPEEAHEEFEDIRDEIGMLKNSVLRKSILALDVFKRLNFCLIEQKDYPKLWHRREEVWEGYKTRQANRRRF